MGRLLYLATPGLAVGLLTATAAWISLPLAPAPFSPTDHDPDPRRQLLIAARGELDRAIESLDEGRAADETGQAIEVPVVQRTENSSCTETARLEEEIDRLRAGLVRDASRLQALDTLSLDPATLEQQARRHERLQPLIAEQVSRKAELERVLTQVHVGTPTHRAVLADLRQADLAYREAFESVRAELEWKLREDRGRELGLRLAATADQLADRITMLRQEERLQHWQAPRPAPREASPRTPNLDALREARTRIDREIRNLAASGARIPRAVEPRRESSRSVILVALVAGCSASAVTGLLGRRGQRPTEGTDLLAALGLPVLATLPDGDSSRSGSDGALDELRNVLLHRVRTTDLQVLMTSGARSDEGRITLARQLATRVAAAGLRTLLIDGSGQSPSLHRAFDVPLSPGWAEALCQDVEPSGAVRSTGDRNLSILTAGQATERTAAALAQGYPAEDLLRRLRSQFDLIIVDTGPADAAQIGPHVDGAIFMVRPTRQELSEVRTASQRLARLSVPVLGLVALHS